MDPLLMLSFACVFMALIVCIVLIICLFRRLSRIEQKVNKLWSRRTQEFDIRMCPNAPAKKPTKRKNKSIYRTPPVKR